MARAAADDGAQWRWNVVVAVASGLLVLALTCSTAPLSRLMSLRLAVYLGRVSYALYLIQLTPLGNGLLYGVLPGRQGIHVVSLYVGMDLVAAMLFELVEEPARETILGLWRKRSPRGPGAGRMASLARVLAPAILLGALTIQHLVWALGSTRLADDERILEVLGEASPDIVQTTVAVPAADGREPRVRLPASWRSGPIGDLRAPRSLLVFVDGEPVPFLGARPPAGPETAAYYRRPRAEYLSLQLEDDATVTVVHRPPLVALRLALSRLAKSRVAAWTPLLLLAAAAFALFRIRGRLPWGPRVSLALGAASLTTFLVSGIHLQAWAPLVVALEAAALVALVIFGGRIPTREPPPAFPG
jgi:hypothetical protein